MDNDQMCFGTSLEGSRLFGCVVAPAEQFQAQLMKLSREFTPRYEVEKGSLALLDLSGLSHLFQTPHDLAASIKTSALDYGIDSPRIALARRLQVARRLALFRPGLSIALDERTETELLGALPLESLDLDDRTLARLRNWGLHHSSDLARLPASDLRARGGVSLVRAHESSSGRDERLLVPLEEKPDDGLGLDPGFGVEDLSQLVFLMFRLLDPLCAKLKSGRRAATAFEVTLFSRGWGHRCPSDPLTLAIGGRQSLADARSLEPRRPPARGPGSFPVPPCRIHRRASGSVFIHGRRTKQPRESGECSGPASALPAGRSNRLAAIERHPHSRPVRNASLRSGSRIEVEEGSQRRGSSEARPARDGLARDPSAGPRQGSRGHGRRAGFASGFGPRSFSEYPRPGAGQRGSVSFVDSVVERRSLRPRGMGRGDRKRRDHRRVSDFSRPPKRHLVFGCGN